MCVLCVVQIGIPLLNYSVTNGCAPWDMFRRCHGRGRGGGGGGRSGCRADDVRAVVHCLLQGRPSGRGGVHFAVAAGGW